METVQKIKKYFQTIGVILFFISLLLYTILQASSALPPNMQKTDNITSSSISGAPNKTTSSVLEVKLNFEDDKVVMENGIIQVTFSNPGGVILGIQYKGVENLLKLINHNQKGGYWDLNGAPLGNKGTRGIFNKIIGTSFEVIAQNEELVELSFKSLWDSSLRGYHAPLNIDKRFIMLRGSSGFYSYAIYEHLEVMPGFILYETRIVFWLKKEMFRYMAIADNRQRYVPLPEDRSRGRGQALAYPEAVLLVNPVEPEFKGEVDDKYQYSCENKDNKVHGFISTNPPIGFWQISPSNEFRTGGPTKQDLTSHVNPTTLAMFVSAHYGGEDVAVRFESGEKWKKVFGPVFIYLNSESDGEDLSSLWEDAKQQMKVETDNWPYNFPSSEDFQKSEERGLISGRLFVQDIYVNEEPIPANGAFIGLAAPGKPGSWQTENKGYQFWTTVNEDGSFTIANVISGNYILYAWVPGFIGDYCSDDFIVITPGSKIDMGDILYKPPRDGPTLWEIGYPDRTAAEFYIPDPDPKYVNRLYINHPDRFRQYGLWERYTDLYPEEDLVYTVGVSDYRKDWFFAQVDRKIKNGTYQRTTWKIKFSIEKIVNGGIYKLRVAIASATRSSLEIRVNNPKAVSPLFSSGKIGSDNAIARHGIHGLHYLYNIDIPSDQLMEGENIMYLSQLNNTLPPDGFMYDYLRLECPAR